MADNNSGTLASSPDANGLRPIACDRCRVRRTFCSKESPSCLKCRESNSECIYTENRKIAISERQLRNLQARLKAFEELFARHPEIADKGTTSSSSDTSQLSPENHVDQDPDLGVEPLEGFSDLFIDPSGKTRTQYLGCASSRSLGRKLQRIVAADKSTNRGLHFQQQNTFYLRPSFRLRRPSVNNPVALPPYAFAKRLFAAQYTYIGTIFAFAEPEEFDLLLQAAYYGPPDISDRDGCLAYAKVLVVLAFGQLYSVNQWNGSEGPPGFELFTYALEYLPDIYEEGSVLFVETLGLIGYFMQNIDYQDAGFLYIGVALRMAISLALHHEVSSPHLDDATKEHRRRVWWSIYSMDRILSVKSGNPLTIQDEDIGVSLPSKLPHEPDYCPAVVLHHYTELSRILGRIMKNIYQRKSTPGSIPIGDLQDIMTSLYQWDRDLPDELRYDPNKLHISRESVSTLLHYNQCINMTVRPLLLTLVQKRLENGPAEKGADWRTGLHQQTIGVIEGCLMAARSSVEMMKVCSQKNLVATYGFMDGEHAFSAAIVLVMFCVAFPYTPQDEASMDMALELLQNMAERGSNTIAERYRELADLRSRINLHSTLGEGEFTPDDTDVLLTPHHTEGQMQAFAQFDNAALGEMLYDPNTGDFRLWQQGYTNPALNIEYNFPQWTRAVDTSQNNMASSP